MNTQPHPLTTAEWDEIGTIEAVRQSWGVEDGEKFADLAADCIYGVKFDFHAVSPGYVGPLYILQGDALAGDPPIMLIRARSGKLIFPD
jgi:hypothetical protein